jgi:hypothetical protein
MTVSLPAASLTSDTVLKWSQKAHSGADFDEWALDHVLIAGKQKQERTIDIFSEDFDRRPQFPSVNQTVPIIWCITNRIRLVVPNGSQFRVATSQFRIAVALMWLATALGLHSSQEALLLVATLRQWDWTFQRLYRCRFYFKLVAVGLVKQQIAVKMLYWSTGLLALVPSLG